MQHHPRMMADVNGDGKADVVGFANSGVQVSLSDGARFFAPEKWVSAYGVNTGGWSVSHHPRMLSDVNGDGKADVIGFSNSGPYVALKYEGATAFKTPVNYSNAFGGSQSHGGWNMSHHPRMMADVNGDGRSDVVGFANSGVFVGLAN